MAHLCAKICDKNGALKYLHQCKNKSKIYGEYSIICQEILAQIYMKILGKEQIYIFQLILNVDFMINNYNIIIY